MIRLSGLEMFMKLSLTVLVALCYSKAIAQPCTNLLICGDCIRAAGCVWCNATGYSGSRCFGRNVSSSMGCTSIMDPRSAPTSYTQVGADPISTTTPTVALRPGDPLTVTVDVTLLPNQPLDLYILMDLSGSMGAPLAGVTRVSQLVAQQVSSVTNNVRVGFGSFNDKPTYPFSYYVPNGCPPGFSCTSVPNQQQYSFFHRVNFSANFSLPPLSTTQNLDLPESSFDALVQVVACEQLLGWRNRSVEGSERGLQRFVLLLTDNQPHLAGDGRLGNIYKANDGLCRLRPYLGSAGYLAGVPGELVYNEDSLFYDYPSIGLVANLLKKYEVIPIFGVVPYVNSGPQAQSGNFLPSYEGIQNFLNSKGIKAFSRQVTSNATELLDIIKTVYQEVIQNIELTLPTPNDIALSISRVTCPVNSTLSGKSCVKVALNQTARFDVTLTLQNCNTPSPSSLTFSAPGFGSIPINVERICSCACDSNVVVNAPECNYRGNFSCGGCLCISGWTGASCERSSCNQPCLNGSTCDVISGKCLCASYPSNYAFANDSTTGILLPPNKLSFAGDNCSCNNFQNCPTNSITKYICSGRGKCACGGCQCDRTQYSWTWQGSACECPANYSDCYDTSLGKGQLCSDHGTCSCDSTGAGKCVCKSGYTGQYCETIVTIPPCSTDRCILDNNCNNLTVVMSGSVSQTTQICFLTDGDCTYSYNFISSTQIMLNKANPDCQLASWIIAVIAVAALLFLFVVICALIKIILVILDYVEVKRWEKELKEADFSKNQNPLYQSPEMQYTNVAYGKAM